MRLFPLFVLAACSGSPKPPDSGHGLDPHPDLSCPLEVPGTSMTVEDAPGGAALVFVTTGPVDQVRTRAKTLADMHNQHASSTETLAGMIAVDGTAASSNIDGGARVVFTATTPDGAGKVQSELRMHAQHLSTGSCKMAM